MNLVLANPFLASIIAFVVLVVGIAAWKGRKLQLFSREYMFKSKLLRFPPFRFVLYLASGLTWYASRYHVPAIEFLLTYSMGNRVGMVLRAGYWKARLRHMGKNVTIDIGARFTCPCNISIGDYAWIDKYVLLMAGKDLNLQQLRATIVLRPNANYRYSPGELRIGRFSHIAPYAIIQASGGVELGECASVASGGRIYSMSNHIRNPKDSNDKKVYKWSPRVPQEEQLVVVGPVVLKNNSGLGINAVVLPGVTINENSLVAVNSVALHDVPPNTIAKGT